MNLKNIAYVVVTICFIGATVGGSFFGGYAIGRYEFRPFALVQKVEKTLFGKSLEKQLRRLERFSRKGRPSTQFQSIFLRLSSEGGTVPVERSGDGGGLTSFGDAVLLVTHEGKIFSARSADKIEETAIETPDNGFSAYKRAAASERFRDYLHDFSMFRYNDILYYQSDAEHGLAVTYTEFDAANDCYRTTLAVLVLDPNVQSVEQISASKEDWDIVYRTQPCLPLKKRGRAIEGHMAGDRITFRAPATIYLASGEYHLDGVSGSEALSQDRSNDYGKVIAIDLVSRQAKIVSIGHRNMQGIAVDPNGQLWVVEHGARGGDELNRIVEGENYGWPEETLGTQYNTLPWPNTRSYGRHNTFMAPTFAWLPSVAPSNLTVIEGFHDSWDGDMLMASLAGLSLFRIRVKDERVLFAEKIQIGKRIRYVHQHSDGRLVLWSDDKYLIFLTVADVNFVAYFIEKYFEKAGDAVHRNRNRIEAALDNCMQCHSFEPEVHTTAPSLASIFEAPIGATGFSSYSEALQARSGNWSRQELMTFLHDPEDYAPGTLMPDPEIDDPFVLGALIDLLEASSTMTVMRKNDPG